MSVGLHEKYPLFLSDFNETSIFSTDFSKNTKLSNFMKTRTDGQHDETTSLFLQFYKDV